MSLTNLYKVNDEYKTLQTELIPGARLLVLDNNKTYQQARLIHKDKDGSLIVNIFETGCSRFPLFTRIPFSEMKQNPSMIQFDPKYSKEDIPCYPLTPRMEALVTKLVEKKDYCTLAQRFWSGMTHLDRIDGNSKQTFVIDLNRSIKYLTVAFNKLNTLITGTDDDNQQIDLQSFMTMQRNCNVSISININIDGNISNDDLRQAFESLYRGCNASNALGAIYLCCFKEYRKASKYFDIVIKVAQCIVDNPFKFHNTIARFVKPLEELGYCCACRACAMIRLRNNDEEELKRSNDNYDCKDIYYVRQWLKFKPNDAAGMQTLGICLLKRKCICQDQIRYPDKLDENENKSEKKDRRGAGRDNYNSYSEAFDCLQNSYNQDSYNQDYFKFTNHFLSLCYCKGLGCQINFKKCHDIHLKYVDDKYINQDKDIRDQSKNKMKNKSQCSKLWLIIESLVFAQLQNNELNYNYNYNCTTWKSKWKHPLRDEIYNQLMDCLYNYVCDDLYYGYFIKIIMFQIFENNNNINSHDKEKMEKADCMLIGLMIVIKLYGFLQSDTSSWSCNYKQFKSFLFDKCLTHLNLANIAQAANNSVDNSCHVNADNTQVNANVPCHLLWIGEWIFGFFQYRKKEIQIFDANIIDPIIDLIFEYELAIVFNPNYTCLSDIVQCESLQAFNFFNESGKN